MYGNRFSLIQLVQELLYEPFTWLMLVPKTLIRILGKPPWIFPYVDQELDKRPDDQFQDYLAPPLFWVLIAFNPTLLLTLRIGPEAAMMQFGVLNINMVALNFAVLLLAPAVFCAVVQAARRQPVEKQTLKPLYYMQCYILAPIGWLESLACVLLVAVSNTDVPSAILVLALSAVAIAELNMMFVQALWFQYELNVRWLPAMGLVLLSMLLRVIVSIVLVLLVNVMLFTAALHMG